MIIREVPFSDRLNEALQKRNMKPAELARKTGLSEGTISQYRSGYAEPKRDRLLLIADKLRVNPTWLMGINVPMEEEADVVVHLSKDETVLIEKYRTADARTQQMVRLALFMDNEK